MKYMHYGHNDGDVAVCGKDDDPAVGMLPHGKGMKYPYAWCPECQRILQAIHGAEHFKNPTEAP